MGKLALVNTNRMAPPVAPIGLDYVACAARGAGVDVDVVDLCLADEPEAALRRYFRRHNPDLVGVSFRNADDCFWPSAEWFVPQLAETIRTVRGLTDAPIVLGGVGFSIFAEQIIRYTGADFGIRGDGEQAVVSLLAELRGARRLERVDGLVWRQDGHLRCNAPAWPQALSLPPARDAVDNPQYFRLGGQGGVETKRGCNRRCAYCADPLAKGSALRLRNPAEVAEEMASLADQGVDVVHLCDSEFNIPLAHAREVCAELIRRSLGRRVRWYGYLAVTPFDAALAKAMRRAGCVGINFTGDSACDAMLSTYRQPHGREDLAAAVRLCRGNDISVMIDLLLGGPGETPESVAETVSFIKEINPDCAGAALGVRLYPGTGIADTIAAEGLPEENPGIRRRYSGPVDFFRPTFYISPALGERPAALVRELTGGDRRFFEPTEDTATETGDADASAGYNYNDNTRLVEAIANGDRGAYWEILRRLR